MQEALQRIGVSMYKTKLSKSELVVLIAEMNGVSERQVYRWLAKGGIVESGRIIAALEDIEKELGK